MVAMISMNIVFANIIIKSSIYTTGIVIINITSIFLTNIKAYLVCSTYPIDYYTNLILKQLDVR